jgi:tripartite ATP-independent transporter DctM subunit
MAYVLFEGNIIKDLFAVIHRLVGRRRSPLGFATIAMGGVLGAVSGSATAISGGLAVLVSPELKDYGYDKNFSVALAAIGGSLSALMPPSIIIIIYASITETSIGKMFLGAVIPATMLMVLFGLLIIIFEKLFPENIIDQTDHSPDSHGSQVNVEDVSFLRGLSSLGVIVFIGFIVFGGIFGGIVTATEAGGFAAFTSIVLLLAMRKITFKKILESSISAARFTAMLMAIVLGAQIFGRFISLSMIPQKIIFSLQPIMEQPSIIILVLLFILFLAGMILESAAAMVLVLPIIDPILTEINADHIWFGVCASFVIVLGLLAPPVGLATYSASAASGTPVGYVFRHTTIYAVIAALVITPFLFIFPELITWLPNLAR